MVPRAKALLDGMESWSGWKFVAKDWCITRWSPTVLDSNRSYSRLFGEEISSQSVPLPVINRVMTPLNRDYIHNCPFIFGHL